MRAKATKAVAAQNMARRAERLLAGVAGAFGQHVVELPVRLSVYLVEHQAAHVESVLGTDLGTKHLVKAAVAVVDDALTSVDEAFVPHLLECFVDGVDDLFVESECEIAPVGASTERA